MRCQRESRGRMLAVRGTLSSSMSTLSSNAGLESTRTLLHVVCGRRIKERPCLAIGSTRDLTFPRHEPNGPLMMADEVLMRSSLMAATLFSSTEREPSRTAVCPYLRLFLPSKTSVCPGQSRQRAAVAEHYFLVRSPRACLLPCARRAWLPPACANRPCPRPSPALRSLSSPARSVCSCARQRWC